MAETLVPANEEAEPEADEETPLLELKDQVARLEAEAAELRLRAELLDRAVGVPAPGASASQKARRPPS